MNRTDTSAIPCPACSARASWKSGTIDVAQQHATYVPSAVDVQRQLSAATEAIAGQYDMMTCSRCGLLFCEPMIAPTSDWYQVAYRALDVQPEQRWEYDIVLRELTSSDFVYEIGCGPGAFLLRCRERGIPATGTDFSDDAVEKCRRQGLAVSTMDVGLRSGKTARDEASTVVAFHVLEHLDCPDALFRHASEIGNPQATLWLSVPSDSRVSQLRGLREPLDEPPHHLTRWTDDAFGAIGSRNGWRLVSVTREPFSWRAALWSVASHFRLYEFAKSRRWLRSRAVEKIVRGALYPYAFARLVLDPNLNQMSGFSMIARYQRTQP
jgi:SAM-dependent methyltransferase